MIIDKTLDPWDREFRYKLVDGVAEVSTLGADGAPGGSGNDEDLAERFRCSPALKAVPPRSGE